MIKNQTLWFLSRLGVVVADGGGGGASFRNCRLISSFGGGSMALFNTKGYGFSQVGGGAPPPNEILRPPRVNPQSPFVGLGKGRTSINACHWLSLKSYSHRSAASSDDGTGNGFQNPPRAFAPYPQLRHYSGVRLDEGKKDTKFLVDGPDVFQRGNPLGFLKHSLPEKLVVAVDVDEVLGSFVSALNKFIADRYSSNHSVSEYHVYEFYKIWNCSRNEADIRVHEFFKTSYFKTGIHPIPGARVTLHKLSTFCNLSVVTSRQNAIKDHTIEWIEKHYPGLFEEIHFGNHFALDGTSRPKSEICRCLGAQVLIDDNPRYAIECAEAGIRVLLFDYENSYPWCKTESDNLHPLITKVHNWEEVEHQLVSCITP